MKKQIILMSLVLVLMLGVIGFGFAEQRTWDQISTGSYITTIDAYVKNIIIFKDIDYYIIKIDTDTAVVNIWTNTWPIASGTYTTGKIHINGNTRNEMLSIIMLAKTLGLKVRFQIDSNQYNNNNEAFSVYLLEE